MNRLFLLLFPFLIFVSTSTLYAERNYYSGSYSSGYYGQRYEFCINCDRYHYRNHPHSRQVYSTGNYYSPRAAYYGEHEQGAGEHVPTGSVASPYQHGEHHGYHNSQEQGWHSGSHYGHE